jgi:cation diffusion facilitator CzcD-associated flavoprotein CzcO
MATAVNTIHRVGGTGEDGYTYYPILVIGAGASGIAMGCRLKQVLHTDQFRIADRRAGLGGVWYTNRYPGVAGNL